VTDDLILTAFMLAVGDALTENALETRAIVEALRVKGMLSVREYTEAREKLLSLSSDKMAAAMAVKLRKRMAEHLSMMRGPDAVQ
jgi:hypothetical protein